MNGYDRMVGKQYGHWTVFARDLTRRHQRGYPYLLCRCSCGEKGSVHVSALKDGTSTSCGCHRSEVLKDIKTTHGHADQRNNAVTRAYRAWTNIKTRCYNKRSPDYPNYGGRGIVMCQRWLDSFENFLADMGEPPEGMSLDRERVNEGYAPGNCRWATPRQQTRNRRTGVYGVINGERLHLCDAVDRYGSVSYRTAHARIKYGWSFQAAIMTPLSAKPRTVERRPRRRC